MSPSLGAALQERQFEEHGHAGDVRAGPPDESAVASAVPPVASTSSTISTRSPGSKASVCTSIVAVPYSSW